MTLKHLISGDSHVLVGMSYRISPRTIGSIIKETCNVIVTRNFIISSSITKLPSDSDILLYVPRTSNSQATEKKSSNSLNFQGERRAQHRKRKNSNTHAHNISPAKKQKNVAQWRLAFRHKPFCTSL